jgi:hypothetical protein
VSPIHRPRIDLRRRLAFLLAVLSLGVASAAAPCGVLLAGYLGPAGGTVVPCLVDLQEQGLCFRLPGTTLDAATRTLDAHLQAQGVPRPEWTTRSGANGTTVPALTGELLEIVIAADGPFSTSGTCRIVPER